MTNYKHLELLGGIDDDLILRTEKARTTGSARFNLKLISVAAAITVMAILAIAAAPGLINRPGFTDPTSIVSLVSKLVPEETSMWDRNDVIWNSANNSSLISPVEKTVQWNGIEKMSLKLIESFNQYSANADTTFAISFGAGTPPDDFVYKGKTLKELRTVAENTRSVVYLLENFLLPEGYGENYASNIDEYDFLVNTFGQETVSQYIVDGIFLRDKAQKDVTTIEKTAYALYFEAFYEYCYSKTKQLRQKFDETGVQYLISDYNIMSGQVIIFMTEKEFTEFDFSNIDGMDQIYVSLATRKYPRSYFNS